MTLRSMQHATCSTCIMQRLQHAIYHTHARACQRTHARIVTLICMHAYTRTPPTMNDRIHCGHVSPDRPTLPQWSALGL